MSNEGLIPRGAQAGFRINTAAPSNAQMVGCGALRL
jgi:hypothetical protein